MRKLLIAVLAIALVGFGLGGFACPTAKAQQEVQDELVVNINYSYELGFNIVEDSIQFIVVYEISNPPGPETQQFNTETIWWDDTQTLSYYVSAYGDVVDPMWTSMAETNRYTITTVGVDPGWIAVPVIVNDVLPVSIASALIGTGITWNADPITAVHDFTINWTGTSPSSGDFVGNLQVLCVAE